MRVGFVSAAPFISGAERSLQLLVDQLPTAGVQPVLICTPDSALIPWCTANQVPYEVCLLPLRDKWHPFQWLAATRALTRFLTKQRIDIVHSNQLWSFQVAATSARALGLPRVCHMRDFTSPKAVRWCCTPGVEAVIYISEFLRKQISGVFSDMKVTPLMATLLNPVTLPPVLSPAEVPSRRLVARRRLKLDEAAFVFGFIGQVVQVKGLLELLNDVLPKLDGRRAWQLAVAGRDPRPGAPYESACREVIAHRNLGERVKWLGFLENVDDFYSAIDVAVVPSQEEPLGRVPLEAAAYAKPSIAFATGGLPETIEDGVTGILVPAQDFARFAAAMDASFHHDSERLGQVARAVVERKCEPRAYAARMASLYRSLGCSSRASAEGVSR
jgi:glycosyltransferase involved in cell wall biosynthesis